MANYLSDNSYLAIKKEATAGTPVVPNVFVPLVSESIKTVVNHTPDRRMKGIDWKATGLLRGNRTHEGELVVLCDPDTLGHVLNMVMTKGSTTGDADGYTHPFTVGAPKSYTIEIKKGTYVQRYFGVYADQVKLDFSDGQLQATISIKAMGQVSVMSLGIAASGSVTSLTLDDEYDIAPNRGLVAGDIIKIGSVSLTLLTVASDGITVTFASTAITASVGDPIILLPQTASLATLQDPFYFGNIFAGFGVDATAAATAAGARTTATALYDLSVTIKNNLFAQNGTNRRDPVAILQGTKEAQIALKQLFQTAAQRQAWLDRVKQALVLKFYGKFIKADFSTQELCTLTFNNIKLITHDNAIKVGDYIMDDEMFEVLYDGGDSAAMSGSLINRTAGTAY